MRSVLLICPRFYDYYLDIKKELEKRGFEVLFNSDQIEFSKMGLVLNKVFKKRKERKMSKYIRHLIRINENIEYDYLILINGKDISQINASKLRSMIKAKKYVYYAWDSIANFPNIKGFVHSFDSILSFDIDNCKEFGFKLLPLFYSFNTPTTEKKYEYSIIMNFYPNKIDGYELLKDKIPKNITGFVYLRLKSYLQFLYFKFKYKKFKKYKINEFKYKSLNRSSVYDVFSQSKVVFDVPLLNQNGLTMRTFEAISHGCKLITTNPSIKQYDFYDETNVLYVDENVQINESFFSNIAEYDYILLEKYSIKEFVNQLLDYNDKIRYLKEIE